MSPRRLTARALAAALVLAGAAGLAACDDGDDAAADPGDDSGETAITSEQAAGQDPCDLLEADEVASTLNIDATSVIGSADVGECVWAPDETEIAFQILMMPTTLDFQAMLDRHTSNFGTPTQVAGIGSDAYYYDVAGVARILVFREDDLSFELDMVHKDYAEMTADHQGALEELAQLAVERLDG